MYLHFNNLHAMTRNFVIGAYRVIIYIGPTMLATMQHEGTP